MPPNVSVLSHLHVLITEQDGEWFAQGIEIDYAASGRTLDEAQRLFERGLSATIDLHLRRFHTTDRLLKFAPENVWSTLKDPQAFELNMVTTHDLSAFGDRAQRLPFSGIAYLPDARARHALAA